jgi:hypothetical protein
VALPQAERLERPERPLVLRRVVPLPLPVLVRVTPQPLEPLEPLALQVLSL